MTHTDRRLITQPGILTTKPWKSATEKERFRAAGIILLNGNENAYGPSTAARKAMMEAVGNSNRYPDDHSSVLKKQVAEFWNIGTENILFGAGSSEFLGLVSLLVSSPKGKQTSILCVKTLTLILQKITGRSFPFNGTTGEVKILILLSKHSIMR